MNFTLTSEVFLSFFIIDTIKSVLVKEEEVMPAALYVIVAGFAGSIVASRRMLFQPSCSFLERFFRMNDILPRIS